MSEPAAGTRRMGGRAARRKLRAAPPREDERAVRPGMIGGRYRPLDESGVARVHAAALDVLERVGLSEAIPTCIDAVTAAGGRLGPDGRLLFPRALVEDTVAGAARGIVLHGQAPRHDLELAGNRVYFGTAGAAVHMVDPRTREYRESTLADLYDIARLVDTLDHIHFFQRPIVCRDLEDPRDLDLNTCYAAIAGTSKHVGTSWVQPAHVGRVARDAPPGRGRRGPLAGAPLRQHVELLRGAAVAVRRGRLPLPSKRGCAAACRCCCSRRARRVRPAPPRSPERWCRKWRRCWPGSSTSMPSRPDTRRSSARGRSVSDLRTGAMSGGSGEQGGADWRRARRWAGSTICRPASRPGWRIRSCRDAQGRLREGLYDDAGRTLRSEPRLRVGGDAGEPARRVPGELRDRQRHARRGQPFGAGDRHRRREPLRRGHARGVYGGPQPLPRAPPDPRAHAARVRLSGDRPTARAPRSGARQGSDGRRRARGAAGCARPCGAITRPTFLPTWTRACARSSTSCSRRERTAGHRGPHGVG